ncbi:MAG: VOC family protein [Chloroflexi bacterium]|nr:VOC family protein [Chloroflexota bacterium]
MSTISEATHEEGQVAMPFELKADHCGISVPDLESSIVWYCDMLGFSVEQRFTVEVVPFKAVFLRHGDFRIELFEVPGAAPLPEERRYPNQDLRTHGTKHIAFVVQDVRAVFAELKRRGVDIAMDVFMLEGMSPGGFIRDNAGNLIELLESQKR